VSGKGLGWASGAFYRRETPRSIAKIPPDISAGSHDRSIALDPSVDFDFNAAATDPIDTNGKASTRAKNATRKPVRLPTKPLKTVAISSNEARADTAPIAQDKEIPV
jgi:hypothetical protein